MLDKTLGLMELENTPINFPGALASDETFQFPVKHMTVTGASARNLVDGDRSVRESYISCARQLEKEGVAAITSNCGFSALFQADVSAAVSIPVALSSLQLVPLAAATLPAGRKVGIITYDSTKLADHHYVAAGWSSANVPISIAGIEGSQTWRQLAELVPAVTPQLIIDDVMSAAISLLRADPAVGILVFECAAFTLAAETVRCETGLPVADYVSLAKNLIETSPPPGRSAVGPSSGAGREPRLTARHCEER